MLRTKCPRTRNSSFDRNESDCQIFEQSVAPVISDKDWEKVWSRVDDNPKLFDQSLAVKEIVGGHQEVPGRFYLFNKSPEKDCHSPRERPKPWQIV